MSMVDVNEAWNTYIDKFGCEPQNATQLQKFSRSSAGKHLTNLSYKDAQKIFQTNKGKGKIDHDTTQIINTKPIKRILLVLLCGLPGSGKTTLAKHFEQVLSSQNANNIVIKNILPAFEHNKTNITYHHVCYDTFLFKSLTEANKNHNGGNIIFDNLLWKKSRNAAFIEAETLVLTHIKNNEKHNYSLIFIDDNMYFRSMRYKFYKLAKKYSTGFCIIYLNTNKNQCIERNNKRKGMEKVQTSVIQRMSDKFQPPNSNKYSWEYNNCFIFEPTSNVADIEEKKCDTAINACSFDHLYKIIQDSWHRIPVVNEIDTNKQFESRKTNLKNLKHQADLKLRKSMSTWMQLIKGMKNINISDISKQIVGIKKNVLEDVNKCVIDDVDELNIIVAGFEHEFNEMVAQYFELLGIEMDIYECKNEWKPARVSTPNLMFNFFADSTRIYWNKSKNMDAELWTEYLKVYKHLTAINHKEMKDQHRTKHVHVALTSIAMYKALKNVKQCDDKEIRKQIKGMFHSMLKNIFKGYRNRLRRSNNAWVSFKEFVVRGTKGEYGTFEPEFIRNDENAVFWNFHKCTFHEICVQNEASVVGPMLCDYDYILAEYISPWITFKRDKTIACGDNVCTFRYCKNECVNDIEDWCM